MRVWSFSYRDQPPRSVLAGAVLLDCRHVRNPHRVAELRERDGRDQVVQQYVAADVHVSPLMARAYAAVGAGKDVAFGCVGGRHRSVALAELFAGELRAVGVSVQVGHTALD